MHKNIEIKARHNNPGQIREILLKHNAKFIGTDHQIDTYMNVQKGRLKLREGKIENNLIYYRRNNQKGPKQSDVILYQSNNTDTLKQLLIAANGVQTIVEKEREIYFIENIKFHIDNVKNLGTYIEIEAIDEFGNIPVTKLTEQCEYYLKLFGVQERDLVADSYSDMVGE